MAETFREELDDITCAQDFWCNNVKVKCEDEYCIHLNDKITKKKDET